MRLDAAEDRVRYATQHVGDTTRLTQVRLREVLNRVYRQTRSKLQEWAPELYTQTTGNLVLAAGDTIGLTSVATPFENVHRIDVLSYAVNGGSSVTFDRWQKVERAGGYPDEHAVAEVSWERRANLVVFHPEGEVAGTFRVIYHFTPTDLSTDAATFELPPALDEYFIEKASAEVLRGDRNRTEAKYHEDLAKERLEEALPVIYRLYGSHGDNSGFVQLQGY